MTCRLTIRPKLTHGPIRVPVPRHAIPIDYRRRSSDRPPEHGPQAVPAGAGWSFVAYVVVALAVAAQIVLAVLR